MLKMIVNNPKWTFCNIAIIWQCYIDIRETGLNIIKLWLNELDFLPKTIFFNLVIKVFSSFFPSPSIAFMCGIA